ncbi:30S ribosomal protein S21 [Senegalia massiliensis]|uniref:Small ribosomal subunit protein bS21 n=1 Tax=Senegalia massiliensis TaxID=1720316 RepID=A0A845QWX1_9CLOT|nr:30S ribosomal protein S21 [Senegalia massiliensis]NBI05658.1 30S ribosomal protein S21 [Senegalia massiliensis]
MAEIKVGDSESLENALRRFKRQCSRSGVLSEARKREHYEKPSVARKKKAEAARRKNKRKRR